MRAGQKWPAALWQKCHGVVTEVNGPKVNSLPTVAVMLQIAFGYMLENPSIRPVLAVQSMYVQ